MTDEEQKTAYLMTCARRFYQEAEAPDGNDWEHLFGFLARRDTKGIKAFIESFGVDDDFSEPEDNDELHVTSEKDV
jgi:hypothetical protein